ncbi:MAG: L,D-transpeptidase family protein [Hyphomicrobiales bacterium]|nr:L,D-transpeptidase family protein [Hyphomicrobiales bacterium]
MAFSVGSNGTVHPAVDRARGWFTPALSAVFLAAFITVLSSAAGLGAEEKNRTGGERVDALVEHGATEVEPELDANFNPRDLGAPAVERAILSNATIPAMLWAIERYAAIISKGGWQTIPDGPMLRVGSRGDRVVLLRRRLAITGDLKQQTGDPTTFDSLVEHAVRRFQFRHGLRPDGAVRGETLDALNVPAFERLRQLRTNIVRINTFLKDLPPSYLMVNIPAAEIEAVEEGLVASRHTAIVGKPERETPVLISKIRELNFNPYWHVPESIVARDIIPQMQKDPGYLERYIIRVYTQKGDEVDPRSINWFTLDPKKYLFRQDPGEDINSLGAVKLNFANEYAVFLHDTPQKNLFSENFRYFSSGCVRVQNVEQLLLWLLRDNDDFYWSRREIDSLIGSGERVDVELTAPKPLYIVYITAWANPDGLVQFRNDIYQRDVPGETATAVQDFSNAN